jgi:predicted nucleic acid-binding protein
MTKPAELLFDTNALVDIYRGQASIKTHFDSILNGSLLPYVSAIAEAELWRGLRPDELERHELLLSQFISLPLDWPEHGCKNMLLLVLAGWMR